VSHRLKECRLSALARVIYFRVEHTWDASQNQALLQLFAPVCGQGVAPGRVKIDSILFFNYSFFIVGYISLSVC
jgi:hypothetical protein